MPHFALHKPPIGQIDAPFSAQDGVIWQAIRFYEQRIVDLELLLTQLTQYEQVDFTTSKIDASAQTYYSSIRIRYMNQIERSYHLRKKLLMRLFQSS